MKRADEVAAEHKLDTITHYLLRVFPGAAIRSARVNGGDYRMTVSSSDLPGPYALHIPRTFLNDPHATVEEVPFLFDPLDLARVLRERGWFSLCPVNQPTMREDTTGVPTQRGSANGTSP